MWKQKVQRKVQYMPSGWTPPGRVSPRREEVKMRREYNNIRLED